MSMLKTNLLMNLNHFEATTVMQLAEQLNVPLVVFVTNNINSELKKLIKPEDFEMMGELVFYTCPALGHPSVSGDIVVHGHKARKVISHDVRIRNKGYLVRVSNLVESSSIGATFYPLAKVDATAWVESKTQNLPSLDI